MSEEKKQRPRKGMVWDGKLHVSVYPEGVQVSQEFDENSVMCMPVFSKNGKTVTWNDAKYTVKEWEEKVKGWNISYPVKQEKELRETAKFKAYIPSGVRKICWHNADFCFFYYASIPKPFRKDFATDAFGNVIRNDVPNMSLLFFDVDHIFPWARGGLSDPRNFWALHYYANRYVKNDNILQDMNAQDLQVGLTKDNLRMLFNEVERQIGEKKALQDQKLSKNREIHAASKELLSYTRRRLREVKKEQKDVKQLRTKMSQELNKLVILRDDVEAMTSALSNLLQYSKYIVRHSTKLLRDARVRQGTDQKRLQEAQAKHDSYQYRGGGGLRRKRALEADVKRLHHELQLSSASLQRQKEELHRAERDLSRRSDELERGKEEVGRLINEIQRKNKSIARIEEILARTKTDMEVLKNEVSQRRSEELSLRVKTKGVSRMVWGRFVKKAQEDFVEELKKKPFPGKDEYSEFLEKTRGSGAELFAYLFPKSPVDITYGSFEFFPKYV